MTVQLRISVYSPVHEPGNGPSSTAGSTVTSSPQLSVATTASGPATSGMLSHSTVMSAGPETMVGTMVSSRVTVKTSEIKRPQSSSNARTLNETEFVHSLSLPEHSPKSTTMSPEGELYSTPLISPDQENQPPKPLLQLWLLAPSPNWKRLSSSEGACSKVKKPDKSPPAINTLGEVMVNTVSALVSTTQVWYPGMAGSSLMRRELVIGSSSNHSSAAWPSSNTTSTSNHCASFSRQ